MKTMEELIKDQLGSLVLQVLSLQAEIEKLKAALGQADPPVRNETSHGR